VARIIERADAPDRTALQGFVRDQCPFVRNIHGGNDCQHILMPQCEISILHGASFRPALAQRVGALDIPDKIQHLTAAQRMFNDKAGWSRPRRHLFLAKLSRRRPHQYYAAPGRKPGESRMCAKQGLADARMDPSASISRSPRTRSPFSRSKVTPVSSWSKPTPDADMDSARRALFQGGGNLMEIAAVNEPKQ
jgi:hypothetical protein